ncbi:MAG: FHA domain-containing protein, partial [Myxococcota bacterium]|nr:FHA domain-containing protein [Myxococcota bacterium]
APDTGVEVGARAAEGAATALVRLDWSAGAAAASDRAHPRLVATSTQLAGTTYTITADEVVLGRTEDNDIVVDHRSISKHHAKLSRTGDQWTVTDQGSANGIKVGGEEYTQTVLRKGDVLELGHVKLRFVAAGENYTYTPEDDDPTAGPAGATTGGKGLFISLLVVLAAAGLTFAWFTFYSQDAPVPPPDLGVAKDAPSGNTAENPGTTPQRVVPSPLPAAVDVTPLLNRAGDLVAARKWDAAMAVYREALSKSAENAEAKLGLDKATREKEAQRLYDEVTALFKSDKVEEAWTGTVEFANIAQDSDYHAQAMELQKAVSLKYAGQVLDQAKVFMRSKRYAPALRHAAKALKITPDNVDAKVLLDKARKKLREESGDKKPAEVEEPVEEKKPAEDNKPAAEEKPAEEKKPDAAKEAVEEQPMTAGELYKAARNLQRKGDKPGAVTLYKKAAGKGKKSAWRQLGSLYASEGKNGAAIKSWKKYLKLRPGAPDSETIREAIIRLGGTP